VVHGLPSDALLGRVAGVAGDVRVRVEAREVRARDFEPRSTVQARQLMT
jgi:hypothetical protein